MSTVDIPALRHEIAVLQQLCAVFFQEPLDRRRACLMRANVDIADTLCHLRTVVGGARQRQFLLHAMIQSGTVFAERRSHWIQAVARANRNSGYNPT